MARVFRFDDMSSLGSTQYNEENQNNKLLANLNYVDAATDSQAYESRSPEAELDKYGSQIDQSDSQQKEYISDY